MELSRCRRIATMIARTNQLKIQQTLWLDQKVVKLSKKFGARHRLLEGSEIKLSYLTLGMWKNV